MSRPAAVAVVVLVVLLAWGLMYVGWQRRTKRQGDLAAPATPTAAQLEQTEREGAEVTYVSTTVTSDWLDRVTAHGLGATGRARLLLTGDALVLNRTGEPGLLVPAAALRGARRETARAGKAVPGDGLVVVDWLLGDTVVSTALRPRHAHDLDALVQQVHALVTAHAEPGESR